MFASVGILFLAVSAFGAPNARYGYKLVGNPYPGSYRTQAQPLRSFLPYSQNYQTAGVISPQQQIIKQFYDQPSELGITVDTSMGSYPLTRANGLVKERAILLPVMKALLKVMETDKPAPEDINELMILTRKLIKKVPEGEGLPSLKAYGFDVDQIDGFGMDALKNIGLPETGDLVVKVGGQNYIRTEWGQFPLSDLSLMTDDERAKFLPAIRSFTKILEKDNLNADEVRELIGETSKLDSWNLFPLQVRNNDEPKKTGLGGLPFSGTGGNNGFGGNSGFGGLGGLGSLIGLMRLFG